MSTQRDSAKETNIANDIEDRRSSLDGATKFATIQSKRRRSTSWRSRT
jgi:hypothetical protein